MDFLPSLPVFAAFFLAVVALTVTPGPDMIFFLSKAISQSRKAGFAAMGGAACGTLIHTIMVVAGLSALLAASTTAFLVLKVVGALYLIWLAIDALRSGSAFTLEAQKAKSKSMKNVFFQALGINLLNPKIIVFFVTFLPQFVSPGDPDATGKLLFLGVMFSVISAPIIASMIIYADKIAHTLRKSPMIARMIDYIFATVLGGFAVSLLFSQNK